MSPQPPTTSTTTTTTSPTTNNNTTPNNSNTSTSAAIFDPLNLDGNNNNNDRPTPVSSRIQQHKHVPLIHHQQPNSPLTTTTTTAATTTTHTQETEEEVQYRTQVRKLVEYTLQAWSPLADDESTTRDIGDVVAIGVYILAIPFILLYIAIAYLLACIEYITHIHVMSLLYPIEVIARTLVATITHPIISILLWWREHPVRSLSRKLSQFNRRNASMWLIKREAILNWQSFPAFDKVVNTGEIVKKKISQVGTFRDGVLAVSHKYLGEFADWEDDMFKNTLEQVVANEQFKYVFFDYTCIPTTTATTTNNNEEERTKLMKCIPYLLERSAVLPVATVGQGSNFLSSVWCQLETLYVDDLILEKANMNQEIKDIRKRQHTMKNKHDSFIILPAFIERVCNGYLKHEFIFDQRKATIFVGILRWFVKWYDEKYGPYSLLEINKNINNRGMMMVAYNNNNNGDGDGGGGSGVDGV
jgi:hypothetical protein